MEELEEPNAKGVSVIKPSPEYLNCKMLIAEGAAGRAQDHGRGEIQGRVPGTAGSEGVALRRRPSCISGKGVARG